jgi:hypothetical protein
MSRNCTKLLASMRMRSRVEMAVTVIVVLVIGLAAWWWHRGEAKPPGFHPAFSGHFAAPKALP